MSAIPCSSVSLKTMADGTLRISFDFEPTHAQDAFRLFAAPGTPAAIAALQVGYAAVTDPKPEPKPQEEKPKGGPLSKLAGMWCNDWDFVMWLRSDGRDDVTDFRNAAIVVRKICGVTTRAELDHNPEAAEKFNRLIRGPYMKHQIARGTFA